MQGFPHIAFYSFVFARTGYGTAARAYVHAMDAANVSFCTVSLDTYPHRKLEDPIIDRRLTGYGAPDLHLWHTEPNHVMRLNRRFPRLSVMTTWETESLPQVYVDALNRVGEVWVPSRYNEEFFRQQLSVPVFRLPHPVDALPAPRYNREEFDREMNIPAGSFVASCIGTWQERKNLEGVVEAFLRAFPREDDAILLIKTSFAFQSEANARLLIARAIARSGAPDPVKAQSRIRIFPYYWPDDCLASLMRRTDCYVSLHRGEGWCYPLFDAASLGIPTVSTNYSGPLDFLDPRHHRLVDYRPTRANQQIHTIRFAFDQSMTWADPSLEDAAVKLREVYDHYAEAKASAVTAAAEIRRDYSLETVGRMALERFTARAAETADAGEERRADFFARSSTPAPLVSLTRPGRDLCSPSPQLACS
jgi:glycosyltransferase involved in cell wall biosynthesis